MKQNRYVEQETVQTSSHNAFKVGHYDSRYFSRPLHFHEEHELVLVEKGPGDCFAGNGIVKSEPNSLYFFSSQLAHYFRSDDCCANDDCSDCCSTIYIQFHDSTLPAAYHKMPGCKHIKHLIDLGHRGIKWNTLSDDTIVPLVYEMEEVQGFDRLQKLYTILDRLGQEKDYILISTEEYQTLPQSKELITSRMKEYLNQHFKEELSLDDIAAYTGMNRTALCRHIKKKTGRSVFDHLIKMRIEYMQERLASDSETIASIGYDAGFNNLSSMYTAFKKWTGYTPTAYREMMRPQEKA